MFGNFLFYLHFFFFFVEFCLISVELIIIYSKATLNNFGGINFCIFLAM